MLHMLPSAIMMSSDTRAKLLAAAEELFAKQGYEQTSTRQLIERAGLGNAAAINYYFGNKEGLLRETLKRVLTDVFSAPAQPSPTAETDLPTAVENVIRPAVALHRGDRGPLVARLLGRIVADPDSSMASIGFGEAASAEGAFAAALAAAAPGLTRADARARQTGVMAILAFYLIGLFDEAFALSDDETAVRTLSSLACAAAQAP